MTWDVKKAPSTLVYSPLNYRSSIIFADGRVAEDLDQDSHPYTAFCCCVSAQVGKKEGEKDDGLPLKYKEFEDLCTDGQDDDCDGLIDSDDPDCGMEPVRETSPQQGFAWTADEAAPNAASAAFLALVYSQNSMKGLAEQEALDVPTQVKLRCWAMGQANFLLGVNKQRQSFLVDYARGHAKQAPTQPKHQASSCPPPDQPCDWDSGYKLRNANPRMDLVRGALVGGVGLDESYPELRESPSARVGTHYQAPWLGLLAGLVQTNTNVMSCGQQGVYQKVSLVGAAAVVGCGRALALRHIDTSHTGPASMIVGNVVRPGHRRTAKLQWSFQVPSS